MPEDQDNKVNLDICHRIERMCRYSSLEGNEVSDQSIEDRNIVADLYIFYKKEGRGTEEAERFARANAIRVILLEVMP